MTRAAVSEGITIVSIRSGHVRLGREMSAFANATAGTNPVGGTDDGERVGMAETAGHSWFRWWRLGLSVARDLPPNRAPTLQRTVTTSNCEECSAFAAASAILHLVCWGGTNPNRGLAHFQPVRTALQSSGCRTQSYSCEEG